MKAIIVCTSVSHGNTRRIAEVMGQVLDARVVDPEEVDMAELATYDLVGFGSGIFQMSFHPRLRQFVRSLPKEQRRKAFVFATSGMPEPRFRRYTRSFARLLEQKGFEVVDTFTCRGLDTWLPFKLVGGVSKGHPDATDLTAARTFAKSLRARIGATS
ncbi:flavodoxin family protein [Nocardia iowensis]|uniref:Flavodoxin family protein n=1 Tax=Nocardia iowensis TaxID=204891 RepID=A0ABX8RXH5_NOCIO|nr:flavodoxin family protein [Nocardia iowensis]QXN93065.1 flavodoxin family protein [Nocardia iowensis]